MEQVKQAVERVMGMNADQLDVIIADALIAHDETGEQPTLLSFAALIEREWMWLGGFEGGEVEAENGMLLGEIWSETDLTEEMEAVIESMAANGRLGTTWTGDGQA